MSNRGLILVAGCGGLGAALARRVLAAGGLPLGLTHSEESAEALRERGIPARACDVTDAAACRALAEELAREHPGAEIHIVHSAAGGRGGGPEQYRRVYLEGCRNLRAAFPDRGRFLFTSSTSVYPQTDGSAVTEDSPAEPERETGRILRRTEDETLAAGGAVARLAGLYGPGRSVLLKNFLNGEAVIEVREEPPAAPDGRWINQLHREDAASALWWLLNLPPEQTAGRIFNVTDDRPLTQRALYEKLADRFKLPPPPAGPPDVNRKRGWTHKRVLAKTLRETGWAPRFPSWFDALERDPALEYSIVSGEQQR